MVVLKCKIFAQEYTCWKEIVLKQSCNELWFVKKCRNCTFKVNFLPHNLKKKSCASNRNFFVSYSYNGWNLFYLQKDLESMMHVHISKYIDRYIVDSWYQDDFACMKVFWSILEYLLTKLIIWKLRWISRNVQRSVRE